MNTADYPKLNQVEHFSPGHQTVVCCPDGILYLLSKLLITNALLIAAYSYSNWGQYLLESIVWLSGKDS